MVVRPCRRAKLADGSAVARAGAATLALDVPVGRQVDAALLQPQQHLCHPPLQLLLLLPPRTPTPWLSSFYGWQADYWSGRRPYRRTAEALNPLPAGDVARGQRVPSRQALCRCLVLGVRLPQSGGAAHTKLSRSIAHAKVTQSGGA